MNQQRINILVKRAVFMFATLIPIVVVLEYTGNNSTTATMLTGGILAGLSYITFPDQPQSPNSKDSKK